MMRAAGTQGTDPLVSTPDGVLCQGKSRLKEEIAEIKRGKPPARSTATNHRLVPERTREVVASIADPPPRRVVVRQHPCGGGSGNPHAAFAPDTLV